MFILYQSNDLEVLQHVMLHKFKEINNKNYTILISDHNSSFFLKMFLSKQLGICANHNFILPAKFIWNIYKQFIPEISDNCFFKKNNLVFVIMNLLPKLLNLKEFYILKKYLLNDSNYIKLYDLSYKIADIYDKYLMYRVDWLYKWENYQLIDNLKDEVHQLWQSILWRKIIIFYCKKFNFIWNRCKIYYKFLDLVNKNNLIFLKKYISELFIFNISYLPPIYLNTIYLLSKYIDIHYFIINPSFKYWYDNFIFNKNILNIYNSYNIDSFLYKLNPLIINNCEFFSEYLSLVKTFNICEIDCFVKFNKKNLLNIIKNDVLNFKNSFILNKFLIKKYNLDNSLIFNSSNSYIEELLKLKNFLLNLIQNKKYYVNDILVLVTNIDTYYPYINTVFSEKLCKKYLPFHIMSKNLTFDNKILNLFIDLLNISNIKFTFSKILYFLKNDVFLNKFNISINEFNIISNFIKNDGICADMNNFLVNEKLYEFNDSILLNSIKRILLGYAINDKYCFWNNMVPYSILDNNYFHKLIGKLSDFIFKIIHWKKILSLKYFLNLWIDISKKFLDVFFTKDVIKKNFFLNYKVWFYFYENCKLFLFNKKIKVSLFIKIFINFINKKKYKLYSLSHINFSSFITLHNLPFKIICFLGMNDNIYPNKILNYNFDLMYSNPRLGDRNKFNYDKYIFLNFLLSSKKKIYISYLNFSFLKHTKLFPSILVNNLVNYLNIKKYWNINYSNNILQDNFFIKKINLIPKKDKNFLVKFIKKKEIYFNKFCFFLFNPIKYYMINFFKINYFIFNKINDYNNFFKLDIKKFYFVRFDLINIFLKSNIIDDNIVYYLQILNLFPINSFGKILWIKEKKNILFLLNKIKKFFFCIKKYNFFCKIYDFNLYGAINLCKNYGVIKWLPKNINLIDALVFWIEHLIYCYLGGKNKSTLYGYNGSWSFCFIDKNLSEKYLYKYIIYYYYFNKKNIFFLPKSSNIWILSAYDFKSKKILNNFLYNRAKNKLLDVLYGNYFINGELYDIFILNYLKKFNFKIDLDFIILKSEQWLYDMFSYLIFNI